ncbi:hypothetical protein ACJRO7_007426 [Eucalyptus globulus]|uniref:Uncharacterized protein n=1 Tax=Eucalyptus globulus TaxID=34317 RepID=A0ABD3INH4_EUCGL
MDWLVGRKLQVVGGKRKLACLSLLLLMLLHLEARCYADRHGRAFPRIRGESSSSNRLNSKARFHGSSRGDAQKRDGGDQAFGEEKRRVYTGPNPLHNR